MSEWEIYSQIRYYFTCFKQVRIKFIRLGLVEIFCPYMQKNISPSLKSLFLPKHNQWVCSKSKGLPINTPGGPVPVSPDAGGLNTAGDGGATVRKAEEITAVPAVVSRSCLKNPVCQSFHPENSRSLWKRFQTDGQQVGRATIFRHKLGVLKLCSSTFLYLHPRVSLSNADCWAPPWSWGRERTGTLGCFYALQLE